MKRLLILPAGLVLLLFSCKEKGPIIDFGAKAADTSFMAPPETPQPRMVMIEELTGVTCPNCPLGHQVLKSLEDANPGRIASIGIQSTVNPQCDPVNESGTGVKTRHDNRTKPGADLTTALFSNVGSIGMPAASIDRIDQGGSLISDRTNWPGVVGPRFSVPTKANVTLTSSYNASNNQAFIKVHVAYTGPVAKGQVLTVALTENDVVDAQEQPNLQPAVQDYIHQHVLRDILTSPTGTAILGDKPTKDAGQVYERTFVYTVNAGWNPDNCRVAAFVSNNDGADKEVVQAAEVPLK